MEDGDSDEEGADVAANRPAKARRGGGGIDPNDLAQLQAEQDELEGEEDEELDA